MGRGVGVAFGSAVTAFVPPAPAAEAAGSMILATKGTFALLEQVWASWESYCSTASFFRFSMFLRMESARYFLASSDFPSLIFALETQ